MVIVVTDRWRGAAACNAQPVDCGDGDAMKREIGEASRATTSRLVASPKPAPLNQRGRDGVCGGKGCCVGAARTSPACANCIDESSLPATSGSSATIRLRGAASTFAVSLGNSSIKARNRATSCESTITASLKQQQRSENYDLTYVDLGSTYDFP